jgi:hypothetical protein
MKRRVSVDITVIEAGRYRLNRDFTYESPRYGKKVTVKAGEYDGATGATDITSDGWLVHDQLCNAGVWDDGTPLSNWECSQVLQDILKAEKRWARARYWFWFTWFFGGGEARKNGMLTVTAPTP